MRVVVEERLMWFTEQFQSRAMEAISEILGSGAVEAQNAALLSLGLKSECLPLRLPVGVCYP